MSIVGITPRDPDSKWDKYRDRIRLECDVKISQVCIKTWLTHDIKGAKNRTEHICRNCIRKRYASIAGKEAGRLAVESGQIKQFIAAAALPESRLKAYATAKKKGKRAFTSKAEDLMHEKCCEWFGEVKRWRYITRNDGRQCNVDLYVVALDTYIEVDGVYWHGLNRPYDQLGPDQRGKYDNDRLLDEHCKATGIRLVRITDLEVSAGNWKLLRERITSSTSLPAA